MDKGQNGLAIKLRVEVYWSCTSHNNVELNHCSYNDDRGVRQTLAIVLKLYAMLDEGWVDLRCDVK